MTTVSQIVQERLAGFEIRQAARDSLRNRNNQKKIIWRERKAGKLDRLEECLAWLQDIGVAHYTQYHWGCATVFLNLGISLFYDKTNRINYPERKRKKPEPIPQEPLPGISPSAA